VARGGGDERPAAAPKAKPERVKRPEGMSREAFALLGGSNPVIPTHLLGAPGRCVECAQLLGCRAAGGVQACGVRRRWQRRAGATVLCVCLHWPLPLSIPPHPQMS
jgi:hypothetical protein